MAKSARRQQLETVALYPLDWVEERSGLVGYTKWFLFRKVPRDVSWAQTLGAASLTAFIVQAVTGVFLAMYYKPDPDNAYASIQNITEEVTLGWLVRGMHKWGASVSGLMSSPPWRNWARNGPANGAVAFRLIPTTVAQ